MVEKVMVLVYEYKMNLLVVNLNNVVKMMMMYLKIQKKVKLIQAGVPLPKY